MFQRILLTFKIKKWPQCRVPEELQCRFLLECFFSVIKGETKKYFKRIEIALSTFLPHFFLLLPELI